MPICAASIDPHPPTTVLAFEFSIEMPQVLKEPPWWNECVVGAFAGKAVSGMEISVNSSLQVEGENGLVLILKYLRKV